MCNMWIFTAGAQGEGYRFIQTNWLSMSPFKCKNWTKGFYVLYIFHESWNINEHKASSVNNWQDLTPHLETCRQDFHLGELWRVFCCHHQRSKDSASFISTFNLESWQALWLVCEHRNTRPKPFFSVINHCLLLRTVSYHFRGGTY